MTFTHRTSGILLHPTSLPSDYGIGDFGKHARLFVDKLVASGQSIWQILPLCPIGYGNSPYQSISVFAGNILLIDLEQLVTCELLTTEDIANVPLFHPHRVEYDAVSAYKLPLLKKAYQTFCQKELLQQEFATFCETQSFWLDDFALFQALHTYFANERQTTHNEKEFAQFVAESKGILTKQQQKEYYQTACWVSWPSGVKKKNAQSLKKWITLLENEIKEQKFYQFLFDTQWKALKSHANEKGISIMGDAPIFTAYDSADVWANQKLFLLDSKGFPTVVAGVPPDYFCEEGQLWGNPLYDWTAHKKEKSGFAWWTNRIRKALEDVDYLRIDHFRGFESYWEVPFGAHNAIKGEWKKGPGIAFFQSLENKLGKLPLIAEDLGIITDEVRALREQTGFPGMRILQFAFGNDKNNAYLPHNCDYNSVMYAGTHDNDTTIGWYETATEEEKDHYRRYMNVDGHDVAWDFIRLAMSSPAVCAMVSLQDVLNLDGRHRMNLPGVAGGNWGFRFTWEQWDEGYTKGLYYLTELFGRYTPTDNK